MVKTQTFFGIFFRFVVMVYVAVGWLVGGVEPFSVTCWGCEILSLSDLRFLVTCWDLRFWDFLFSVTFWDLRFSVTFWDLNKLGVATTAPVIKIKTTIKVIKSKLKNRKERKTRVRHNDCYQNWVSFSYNDGHWTRVSQSTSWSQFQKKLPINIDWVDEIYRVASATSNKVSKYHLG